MYDAIVIGARCAGATTAMLFARAGLHVLLVDRAALPSDIPHGHFVHRRSPARLAAWGLLDPVLETNCPPVSSITTDFAELRDRFAVQQYTRKGDRVTGLVGRDARSGARVTERATRIPSWGSGSAMRCATPSCSPMR